MKRKISVKIQSKDELKRVLQTEASVYDYKWYYRLPWNLTENQILYKHARYLRLAEYAFNTHRWNRHYYLLRLLRLQTRYALSIPLNVLGEGFSIAHLGTVIINAGSTVGKNCRIHPGVCIGANGGKPPRIGDNVYLGPGAKVFGDIELADGVMVGANAVVNHSCMEEGAHLVGIPAKAAESHRDECSHN